MIGINIVKQALVLSLVFWSGSLLSQQDGSDQFRPTYRSFRTVADIDAKTIIERLRMEETVLRFTSLVPPTWFLELDVAGGVESVINREEMPMYWKDKSLFI